MRVISLQMFEKLPLDPDGWPRFQRYARMVRTLTYGYNSEGTLDSRALQAVIVSGYIHGFHNLFPRLTVLGYCARDITSWQCAPAFLSHTLTVLWIFIFEGAFHSFERHANSGIELFLRILPKSCPFLTEFQLSAPPNLLLPLTDRLETVLPMLECLRVVDLDSSFATVPKIWSSLASLPQLQIIQCDNRDLTPLSHDTILEQPRFSKSGFPALVICNLRLSHLTLTTLFSSGTPQKLRQVHLSLLDVEDAREVECCLRALSTCQRLDILTLHHVGEFSINVEHILPLLTHQELKRVSLIMQNSFNDADIEQISLALPKLKHLCLAPSPLQHDTSPPTNLTLQSLLSLARHCIALESIVFYITTSPPPPKPNTNARFLIQFRSLRRLNITLSEVSASDSFRVALFLSDICAPQTRIVAELPTITNFTSENPTSWFQSHMETVKNQWDAVNDMFAVLMPLLQDQRRNAELAEKYSQAMIAQSVATLELVSDGDEVEPLDDVNAAWDQRETSSGELANALGLSG